MAKGEAADPDGAAELRRQAEERLRIRAEEFTARDEADALRLLHQLDVHRIELEIQNEELRATRLEAERVAARYAELYEFAPLGYAGLDRDGAVLSVNLAGATLLGLERSSLVGARFGCFVAQHDRVEYAEFLKKAVERAGEGSERCELTLEVEGRQLHVHLTAAVLDRPGGEILLAIQDVSDRVRLEREREEALRLLDESQRVARLGTFALDLGTGRWKGSAALEELLGIGARFDRTTDGFLALVHPDDREELARFFRRVAEADGELDQEWRVVHPRSGEVTWVWGQGAVEYDRMTPVRLVGTLQDVTASRRVREERAQLLRNAEEARCAAEEASRLKDAFMATLSHELRNPLAPISNSLFVLDRAVPGSERARRATAVIARQAGHLARLVDDLLDVARITRGKVQLQRQHLDLNELARSMVEDHRSLFERSGVKLELAAAPAPVLVDGDWHRLAQALGNLLQNGAKFGRTGGATRVIVGKDASELHALVTVSDDGLGMEPEVLAQLFQPFVQADSSLARSRGGLGLGLAVARGIVELHSGDIAAHSAGLGQGTEFVIRLPLARGKVAASQAPRPRAPRALRRVLIIEDNQDAAETLHELLEMQGHEVEVAYTGPEGIEKARSFHPEAVLCDIGLPGMDGYEVAKVFQAEEGLRDAYLVALTGYALPDDVGRAMQCGFRQHVAKPPAPEELDRILAEAPAARLHHPGR